MDNGVVTLKGEAQWDFQRVAAQKAVSHIKGVRGVVDKMTIKAAPQPSDIKSRIRASLKRSALNEGRQIDVRVDGDQVTLSGNVHSASEIGDAGVAAWNSPGVRIVKNDLTLTN